MAEDGKQDAGSAEKTPEWVANIEDDGLKENLSKFESPDAFLDKIGYKPKEKDWRETIADEEGKKFAKDSSDINHFVKRALDLRKQVSNAIIKPGKDATPEQIKAYQKSLGIPESPDEYEFPELPAEQLTDEVKAARKEWAGKLHKMGTPKEVAKGIVNMLSEDMRKAREAQIESDKEFAKTQDEHLKEIWKDDYDKNKTIANRAFKEIADRAGVKLDDLTKIETKDGRFIMDNADMVKVFSAIGREMSEGSLGSVLSESEIDSMEGEVLSLRKQAAEAQSVGDSKRANKLYQKEQVLLAKMKGDKPIVGVGRAA